MFTQRILLVVVRVIAIMLFLIFLTTFRASRAQAANVFTVTNTNDSGAGSLRQAMLDAIAADAGPALIAFNIPKPDPGYGLNTAGVWTIRLNNALPPLTVGAITIDGKTQMTNQGDTNYGSPNVELDGGNKFGGGLLTIEEGYTTIQWLVINRAPGIGIDIANYQIPHFNPVGNYIQYNYVGTDATGTLARPNGVGIEISGGAYGNWIVHNCIAGNSSSGIQLWDSGTDNNHIQHNVFGECNSSSPPYAIPNGGHGVQISDGPKGTVVHENHIYASGTDGIYVHSADSTTISLNVIGTCSTVDCAEANTQNGIAIEGGSSSTQVINNSIWWNKQHGIWISDSGTGVAVTGNEIGKSTLHGIAVYSGAQSSLSNNWIWYNGWSGIAIVNSNNNIVQNNDVGVERHVPDDHRGNGYYGVAVVGGHDNTIGPGNMIAHNGLATASDGIRVNGSTALRNRITQNSIFDNGGKGIALVNGGNGPVLAPTLYQANCQGLVGYADYSATIEILSDASDEGRFYEGMTQSSFMLPFAWNGSFRGPHVTATATDSTGNTSEFSAPISGACLKTYLPLIKK